MTNQAKQIDIGKIISNMSLDDKIGQMFMGNICGGESLDLAREHLEKFRFGVYSSGLSESQGNLLAEIISLDKPIMVVMSGSPFQIRNLPEKVKAIVCAFGLSPFTFKAVSEVIAGLIKPTGRLPVKLES